MINRELQDIIEKENRVGEFIYPSYTKHCFSNIPSTILKFFNIQTGRPTFPPKVYGDNVEYEDSSKIILLLIDGLGYNQWLTSYRTREFLNKITEKGLLSPITSVFPSTTAATLTTVNTGLTPQEHALLEWYVYFREIDMIICTLPFTPLGKKGNDRLLEMGVNPEILFNGETIYQALQEEDVKSFAFIKASYAYSCYSRIVHEGSTIIPFVTWSDLAVRLRKLVEKEKGPAYFYAYIDDLDAIGHLYGPHTLEYQAGLSTLSYALNKEFLEKTNAKTMKETLLVVTSDHGQVGVSPEETVYLNKFEKLTEAFKRSRNQNPILPTGSVRDVFLHIKRSKLEETLRFLSEQLKGRAKIMKTREAVKTGLFGIGKPRKEFYERVGDLLIIPYDNHTVWYEHIEGRKLYFLGYHGGLVEDEMLVPLAIARLNDLT